jgi:hypothetical protein
VRRRRKYTNQLIIRRAILAGRSVLEPGLIRYIGNGPSTLPPMSGVINGFQMVLVQNQYACRLEEATTTKVSELLTVTGSCDDDGLLSMVCSYDYSVDHSITYMKQ